MYNLWDNSIPSLFRHTAILMQTIASTYLMILTKKTKRYRNTLYLCTQKSKLT